MQKSIETELAFTSGPNYGMVKVGICIYTKGDTALVLITRASLGDKDDMQVLVPMIRASYPTYLDGKKLVRFAYHVHGTQRYSVYDESPDRLDSMAKWVFEMDREEFEQAIGVQSQATCNHPSFELRGKVFRHTPDGTDPNDPNVMPDSYSCDIKVCCMVCQTPFHFPGLMMGCGGGPKVNADATELRVRILPGALTPVEVMSGLPESVHSNN